MRITEIRELSVQLEGNIANALVNFREHTVSLVAVMTDQRRDGRPVTGYGFNSIGRFAQGGIIRERIAPRLLAAEPSTLLDPASGSFDPAAVLRVAMRNEKPGGHGDRAGAVAAIELACWDINAKLRGEPAFATIAHHYGATPNLAVPVYAAGGYYYPDDSTARLVEELKRYRDLGFAAYKIKIGGASLSTDLARLEAALSVAGQGAAIAVDANGRFDLTTAKDYGRALSPFGLRWYEEPGDPLDYALNAALASDYKGAIATGENLFSTQDVNNLLAFGGLRPGIDVLQMDAGLSYGLGTYVEMLTTLADHGFARAQAHPHGGHLINLHIAAGLGLGGCEAYPGVFQPFGGYSPECRLGDGVVRPPETPGWGLEQKPELVEFLRRLA